MTDRRIPDATVDRLPVYLRVLLDLAAAGEATVSSEQLAELACAALPVPDPTEVPS